MDDTSPLRAARRRWWLLILFAALGAVVAALPEPGQVDQASEGSRYRATNTMLLNDPAATDDESAIISPDQVPLFATTGDVPQRVKQIIGYPGSATELAQLVTVEFDETTGALTFTTTQESPEQAVLIADTFAEETNRFVAERQDAVREARAAAALTRLQDLESRLDDITAELADRPEDQTLLAQRDAISRQYSVAYEQEETVRSERAVVVFNTLASAEAVRVEEGGLGAPDSRAARSGLGALVGAILGLAVAVVIGRLDRKLRTEEQAEVTTGLRARVLVPEARDAEAATAILTPGRQDSLADSYRTLRNVVSFVSSSLPPVQRARVTLVVSPGASEGKTTITANLAAAIADTGRRTLAVNTDFRRPQLSNRLNGGTTPLPYTLDELPKLNPADIVRPTRVPGVSLLDLTGLGTPDELARRTASLLLRLADTTDRIVVDSSPITATSEVLELVRLADVIVVVVRLGRTERAAAERAMAMLRDLTKAPLLLVVMGVKRSTAYYYYDYHERHRKPSRGRRRKRRVDVHALPAPEPTDVPVAAPTAPLTER